MEDNLLETAGEGESAVETTTVDETPDHTPESETETEVAAEEAPATEEVPTSDDTQAPETATVQDLLDDEPLTPERIGKLRVSKQEREQLLREHENHQKVQQIADSVGGEFGAQALAPLAKLLTQASASPQEVDDAFTAFAQANGNVARKFSEAIAFGFINTPQLAEPLLQQAFGENASIGNIKTLLAFDKAGLIDRETGMAFMRDDADVIQLHNDELQKYKDEITRLKTEVANPVKDVPTRAVQEFENDFHTETPKPLDKWFKQVNWDDATGLKQLVVKVIQAELKGSPQYANSEQYLRDTGVYRNGQGRVGMVETNLSTLTNLSEARGKALIREIQSDIKKIVQKSRNVVLEKAKEPTTETKAPPANMPVTKTQADVDAKFKGKILQVQ